MGWGRQHLDNLKATFFEDNKAGRFAPRTNTNLNVPAKGIEVAFVIPEELRVRYGLMAGDAIHNLRDALDHLAYSLAGKEAGGRTQFPIFGVLTDYADKGLSMIEGFSPTAKTAVERLQPYHAGQNFRSDRMWLLNRMTNDDRHHVAHVAEFRLSGELIRHVPGAIGTAAPVGLPAGSPSTRPLVDGATKRPLPTPPPGMHVEYKYTFGITFEDPAPVAVRGRDAVQVIGEFLRTVEDIVVLLEPEVPS